MDNYTFIAAKPPYDGALFRPTPILSAHKISIPAHRALPGGDAL